MGVSVLWGAHLVGHGQILVWSVLQLLWPQKSAWQYRTMPRKGSAGPSKSSHCRQDPRRHLLCHRTGCALRIQVETGTAVRSSTFHLWREHLEEYTERRSEVTPPLHWQEGGWGRQGVPGNPGWEDL